MEESKEYTQNCPKYIEAYSIMQYFSTYALDLPADFMHRFVTNYIYQDVWIQSDRLYEWFLVVSPNYKYSNFLCKLRDICDESDIKELSQDSLLNYDREKTKGRPQKIYLISYEGLKVFMMTVDKQTRKYYVKLEYCLFKYMDYQRYYYEQKMYEDNRSVLEQLEHHKNRIKELEKEYLGSIYCHTVFKDGDPLDGKIVNVGYTVDYTRRFYQYERDIRTLIDAYKGREILVTLAFFYINGYKIVGELIEKDIPQSELRASETLYYRELHTYNCPNKQFPMEYRRDRVKCSFCYREVLGSYMITHLKSRLCIRHRVPPSEYLARLEAEDNYYTDQ